VTTGARVIARRLREAGCRYAFGLPGGEVLALVEALREAGIRFVLAKHETAAGFMAEGVFHATGQPAVLVATLGPGVTNAVNAVADAYLDRVPMIFLTGCVDADDAVGYTHQILDHRALLRPIAKATLTAVPGAVDAVVDKALAIALDDQAGPVHVDVPIAVASAPEPDNRPRRRPRPAPAAPAEGPALAEARRALAAAERPLLIAGLDALAHGAESEVAAFARDFGMPLITTYKAKGILAEDDPLALGGHGLSPKADRILLPLLRDSDFILLAGYDPIEMRQGWRDPWPQEAMVVEFAAVPNTHFVHRAKLSFVGDVGEGLKALRLGVTPRKTWAAGPPAAARSRLKEQFQASAAWGPEAAIAAARRALPRDAVATVDSGAHRILLSQMWECYRPRTLLQSTGHCTMGAALPLAAGYKLAAPERPVAAFTGDAGLEMVLGELATLRDLGLALPVVVFADRSLALIELKQRGAGLANVGVDFGATDFAAVARALGGRGAVADGGERLEAALKDALAADAFTVIACPLDRRAYDGKF
jgi:acetolactate synthase-1/2/3 large subunit